MTLQDSQTKQEFSAARVAINNALRAHTWFERSDLSEKVRLLELPESCNGFLDHLSKRPKTGGGVELIRIAHVLIPPGAIFGIFINFEVKQINPPHNTYFYQYFSWKQGPLSGAKGVVLIRSGGCITHLICLHGFSFATGTDVFGLPGGFMEEDDAFRADMRFLTELFEEMGFDDVPTNDLIDLGLVHADPGLTNNCPRLFAAVIDMDDVSQLNLHHTNLDRFEMSRKVIVVPAEKLWGERGLIELHTHGFFGVIAARLINRGILSVPCPTIAA